MSFQEATYSWRQNHAVFDMIIGDRGSYTAPHYDFFGMDGYLQLVEGEKLWWFAPLSSEAAFRSHFDDANISVTSPTKDKTQRLAAMQAFAIHQRAGDLVFVPGGWIHCVKNLTNTVSYGGSYLRAWKLPVTLLHLMSTSAEDARVLNWEKAFAKAFANPALYGISPEEASSIRRLLDANRHQFYLYREPSVIVKHCTIESLFRPPPPKTARRKRKR